MKSAKEAIFGWIMGNKDISRFGFTSDGKDKGQTEKEKAG